jgi:hypothetical protein
MMKSSGFKDIRDLFVFPVLAAIASVLWIGLAHQATNTAMVAICYVLGVLSMAGGFVPAIKNAPASEKQPKTRRVSG